ncbi:B12-binding domain-containing radical SAM protein [Patescibacteria group bacterium]
MKVLLIYPPVTVYQEAHIDPHPPLGLAYLAAYLRENNVEVKILDALALGIKNRKKVGKKTRVGMSAGEIKKYLRDFKPDLVGVGVMFTPYAKDAHEVAGLVKSVNPKTMVVFGGAHVSIDPKLVLKDKNVDVAVKGEGEITLLGLVQALQKKRKLTRLTGIAYCQGRKIIQNPPSPFIKNLDELPFPARDLLPLDVYDDLDEPFAMRHPLTAMVTSRGCPGRCVYCAIHSIWGHTWRGRSAKKVVDEIEHLINDFGIKEIHFQDDSMSINKARMNKICDEIIKRKLDIKWTTPNGIAHWTLDKKLIKKMKRAGCYRLTFGIESGNPEMRKWLGKPHSLEQAKQLTQYANKIGLWTIATNILGFPYETKQQIEDTINFAINSDVDFALFYRLAPRWGTPVYEVFKKEGLLPKDETAIYGEGSACDTKVFTKEELVKIRNEAHQRFLKYRLRSFINPARLIRKINSWEDFCYLSRLGFSGLKMAWGMAQLGAKKATSKTFRG